ncbi:hypothetical protein E2986_13604 [Frieseomelitta varia]|uniref:Uso1/p115-like vesicle tethering protein C-terminal domain-containing protein n=1 Tax=Frieseomelitta varia TaxID=561572 RepID=A0A833W3C1_9HYME|nr:hypothetical protein E2986_13604 [Frieseomelitta varia]
MVFYMMQAQVHDLRSSISHLKDQNLVLRAAQTNLMPEESDSINVTTNEGCTKEAEKYKTVITELEIRLVEYASMVKKYETDFERKLKEKSEELEKLKKDQEDLLELLAEDESKIMRYEEKLAALGEKIETDESSIELDTDDQAECNNSVERIDRLISP